MAAVGAGAVAQRVVELKPPAADAQRRVAWTVIAYASFDKNAFGAAEKAFAEAIKLTPEKDPGRADLVERQAAAIYKQAEIARAGGKHQEAAASFRTRSASQVRGQVTQVSSGRRV